MKYALVSVVNGNFVIDSEHGTNKDAAFIAFHNKCAALYGAGAEVQTATVKVVDEYFNVVEDKVAVIDNSNAE